jgi:3-oxoacyl-[acyl-carrier-protein] synthase II
MVERIAITGLGLVTPLGLDVASTWAALLAGRSGIRSLDDELAPGITVRIGGRVDGLEIRDYVSDRKLIRGLSRNAQFAVVAALEATRDAGLLGPDGRLDSGVIDPTRVGVEIGNSEGGEDERIATFRAVESGRPDAIRPLTGVTFMISAASGAVSRLLGATGPSHALATACATGTDSLVQAARLLRLGEADVVVAGGTEGLVSPTAFPMLAALFDAMRALSRRNHDPAGASRPFDRDRDGFVLSEGAAMLVLERAAHARARGARSYAELHGYGNTSDADHETQPSGIGAARAMRQAMAMAELERDEVDLVSAHATSTPIGDQKENEVIREVLGARADQVAVSANKSMLGHLIGAAGALSTAVSALAIANGCIPPTINLVNPGQGCDLDYVVDRPRPRAVRAAIVNAFGFGGHNCVLALRPPM